MTLDFPPCRHGKFGAPDTSSSGVISHSSVQMDLVMHDVPATPSIFSPRTTEFRTMPFGKTDAGDLASENTQLKPCHSKRMSVFSTLPANLVVDPRSPHHGDETVEIMTNIDEVL